MPLHVPPAVDVLWLVLLAWTAGLVVGGALTRLWGAVQPGHFKVIWLVATAFGALAGFGYAPAWGAAVACAAAFAAIYRRLDLPVGLVAAAVTLTASVGAAWTQGGTQVVVAAAATAALLGSSSNAMLLGHWHLNQPGLDTGPLRRLVWGLWGSLGAFAFVTGLLFAAGMRRESGLVVVATVAAGALTLCSAVLTAMVSHLVRTRSIMSATGILYLEILLCFAAAFTGLLAAMTLALP